MMLNDNDLNRLRESFRVAPNHCLNQKQFIESMNSLLCLKDERERSILLIKS